MNQQSDISARTLIGPEPSLLKVKGPPRGGFFCISRAKVRADNIMYLKSVSTLHEQNRIIVPPLCNPPYIGAGMKHELFSGGPISMIEEATDPRACSWDCLAAAP